VLDFRRFIGLHGPVMTGTAFDSHMIRYRAGGWRFLVLSAALVMLPLGLEGCAAVSYWSESLGWSEEGGDAPDGATAGADGADDSEPSAAQAPSETPPESVPQASPPAVPNETTDEADGSQIVMLPAAGPPPVQARILFPEASVELSEPAKVELIRVAEMLTQDQSTSVQLLAFAQASDSGTVSAGRISLTRAFVVRAFLLEQGVQPLRMNLRSLADQAQDGPPDRVDILLNEPG
jgi:outer membrane protein OmpA-like peptidoglycan-associated protein